MDLVLIFELLGAISIILAYYGWRISKRIGHPSNQAITKFKNNYKNRDSGIFEFFFVYFGLCIHIAAMEIYDNVRSRF